MRTKTAMVMAVACGALLLGACGDDDDTPTSTPGPASPTAPAAESRTPTALPPTPVPATPTRPATATATAVPTEVGPDLSGANTQPKSVPASPGITGNVLVRAVRYAAHPGSSTPYDRVVVEFLGDKLPETKVEYVPRAVACGSGEVIALKGPAVLLVTMRQAAAHNDAGQATAGTPTGSGTAVKEVRGTCDFEGVVQYAIALDAPKGFVVTTLANPPRLVIDIKQ